MSKSKFKPLITASVMSAVYLAGLSNVSFAQEINATTDSLPQLTSEVYQSSVGLLAPLNAQGQRRYIVQFNDQAVAQYDGTDRFAAIPRKADNKIQVNSSAVKSYVAYLKQQQNDFLQSVSNTLNRSVNQVFSYQFALNGSVLELTPAEASQVAGFANVKSISADREYELETDVGPQLIGADNVWQGNAPASGTALGEGVVLGILDSGANFDHPSFADIGGDAYDHTNPLGSGNFLGVCDPANTEQFLATYTCNDKTIGGYDFINDITPAGGTDIEGPEDEDGHGTHTASTAGGNVVLDAEILGVTDIAISGVAPHANLVIYDVCYTPAPGAGGGCFGSASIASIDSIIADGLVDVVNYSISGGTSPWQDAVSQAFLSATDSGVFVSASAGNSGPGPGTLGHVEPWTSSVGASTHNRRFETLLSITGPGTPAADVQDIEYVTSNGPSFGATIAAGINYSAEVDPANFEGCVAFPANSFDGLVALISRGACSFEDKVNNASDAGAIAVIVHNDDRAVAFGMNVGTTTTIPSVSVPQAEGLALADFIANNAAPQVEIINPLRLLDNQADSMAGFSSRGPSPFEYNKPDVTAPGVNILAGFADSDPALGTPAEYGSISGTSMSSPHNAGSAALLKELQPNWTVPEIKSALMLTAVTAGVTKEDGVTPADPFDRGAGRIQVDAASSAGLVLNETAFRFLLADPADGGDPKTLNVASYKNDNCVGTCTFQRTFRSVATAPVDYTVELSGMTGTVNPASFTAMPGQTVTIDVEIDGAALPAGDVSFGELQITEVAPVVATSFAATPAAPAIPDDGYDGTFGSMLCETVTVSGVPTSSVGVSLEMAITHSWVGDLTIKAQNPSGSTLGVMSRPDLAGEVDDGSGCCGSNSNLADTDPITFIDGAAVSAEAMPAGFADVNICTDDGICEYAPAPDGVANPPSTFAELGATDPNGDWNICIGDSGDGDTGVLSNFTLNILETGLTGPALHMPLVVTGLPESPDITVDPTSLSATLDADTTTDLNLNISNSDVAGADLNWSFGAGAITVNYLEQGDDAITNGFQAGTYTPDGFGAFTADDFTSSSEITIESMQFDGFVVGNAPLNTVATAVNVHIYADENGVPMGNPEDGLGSAVATLNIPIADASLDLTDNGIGIDVVAANGGAIVLPAGTYWVSVFPDQNVAADADGRWIWFAGGEEPAGSTTQLISPSIFNIPDWSALPSLLNPPANVLFEKMNALITGTGTCGAPWITTSSASGVVVPGANEDVTVTLDSTGIAPGVYSATLCVDSDDPDEPQVLVPVTMTVEGESDLIFADGFEAAP